MLYIYEIHKNKKNKVVSCFKAQLISISAKKRKKGGRDTGSFTEIRFRYVYG